MFRRNGRGRVLLLVFVAMAIVLITLDFRQTSGGPLKRARDISVAIVAPIQRGITTVFRPVGDFFSSVGELGDLRDRNDELEARIEELEQEQNAAEAVLGMNERLLNITELDESWATMDHVFAQFIGRAPSNYRWAFMIDKGRNDGIRPNMTVIDSDGLIGRIIGADSHTATVLMLIDPQSAAGARVEGQGSDLGRVDGNGNDEALTLDMIGTETEVEVGDLVVTAGFEGGIYPPGIPIGTVSEVDSDERNLDQTIEVEPSVDFTSIEFVRVLLTESAPLEFGKGQE